MSWVHYCFQDLHWGKDPYIWYQSNREPVRRWTGALLWLARLCSVKSLLKRLTRKWTTLFHYNGKYSNCHNILLLKLLLCAIFWNQSFQCVQGLLGGNLFLELSVCAGRRQQRRRPIVLYPRIESCCSTTQCQGHGQYCRSLDWAPVSKFEPFLHICCNTSPPKTAGGRLATSKSFQVQPSPRSHEYYCIPNGSEGDRLEIRLTNCANLP